MRVGHCQASKQKRSLRKQRPFLFISETRPYSKNESRAEADKEEANSLASSRASSASDRLKGKARRVVRQ